MCLFVYTQPQLGHTLPQLTLIDRLTTIVLLNNKGHDYLCPDTHDLYAAISSLFVVIIKIVITAGKIIILPYHNF